MKRSRRILSLLLVVVMLFSLSVTAWAEGETDPGTPTATEDDAARQAAEEEAARRAAEEEAARRAAEEEAARRAAEEEAARQAAEEARQAAEEEQRRIAEANARVPVSLTLLIIPLSLEMEQGETTTIEVMAAEDDSQATYSWESSRDDVVAVSGSGSSASIRAAKAGDATITVYARMNNEIVGTDTIPVSVSAPVAPVTARADGSTDLNMEMGSQKNVAVTVSGGSGQYVFNWDSSSNVAIPDHQRGNATIYGAGEGRGYVSCQVSDATDPTNYSTVNFSVTVTSTAKPIQAAIDRSSMSLRVGASGTVTVSASGGSGNYTYNWWKNNLSHVTVSENGATATVLAVTPGSDVVNVDVYDNGTKESKTLSCTVNVESSSVGYDISGSATVGANLSMNTIAGSIANEFNRQFGVAINYGASVRLDSPSGACGAICLQDGTRVSSGVSLTYATLQDSGFAPTAPGTFSTRYTAVDGGNTITGTISISVVGGAGVTSVTISNDAITMDTYSSRFVNVSVQPANVAYTVKWTTDDSRIASPSGNGASATISTQGFMGTTTVYATVTDARGATVTRTCRVTVSSSKTYNPTLTWTLGSDYYGTGLTDSVARQFRNIYGYNLDYQRTLVSFPTTGNTRYGIMRQSNGAMIRANTNYTYQECQNMVFEPVAVGTFTLPYNLSHNGNTMNGTIEITMRGSSVNATISQSSMTLAPYSNQTLFVTVTPANAFYSVSWRSANSDIVTVSGNGTSATVKSAGRTGTTTVGATVVDRNGVETYHSCAVTVSNKATGAYNPSISMSVGVPYTGTGTSDAMRSQYRSVFGSNVPDNAIIRFSSTGNNNVATLRLRSGAGITANTNYTLGEYANGMYIDATSAGTFSLPYTLSYNNNALSGTVIVNVTSAAVISTITLNGTNPYTFSTNSADGTAGSSVLGNSVTNATNSRWHHIRFGESKSGAGTLYKNSGRASLGDQNIAQSDLGSLYFVPNSAGGDFSIPFSVYNASNNVIANGTLMISVKGGAAPAPAPAANITFGDVKDSDWFGAPVKWAVGRGITNGMGKNKQGQETFQPDTTCNNAQIITFLWRSQGSPEPTIGNPFTDVKTDNYFYKPAVWAYEKGLVSGTTFGEKIDCTRAMVVTYMWKLAGRPSAQASTFSDVTRGTDEAAAVDWALSRNITNGMGNDANGQPTFGPRMTCTRGQIVTFLHRAYA